MMNTERKLSPKVFASISCCVILCHTPTLKEKGKSEAKKRTKKKKKKDSTQSQLDVF